MGAQEAVLGVDVGTGSVRAGAFTLDGTLLGMATHPITLWQPNPGYAEQSSEEIWAATVDAIHAVLADAGPILVRGIGFDATCSLVVLDEEGGPLSVHDGEGEKDPTPRNVIVWMDHRAVAEAEEINALGHRVLEYVGRRISPEMNVPKLVWLLRHRPKVFSRAGYFMGLPDFLTWRASGSPSRSLCSVTCKWTYVSPESRWDRSFFEQVGLTPLAEEGFRRIGQKILPPGAPVGGGLSRAAATELGLPIGTPVGASAIDAYAGGIGVIGIPLEADSADTDAFRRRLALIGGTSSCHMAVSPAPRFVNGVWGPYLGAMIPGYWLNEGGQSATGALIDHVMMGHPAYRELAATASERKCSPYQVLNERVASLASAAPFPAALTRDLHVLPDFYGNRSPRADPTLRGMVSGLTLAHDLDDLALVYLATIQAIAYGTRHIIATLNAAGYAIDVILATGGGTRNPLFIREHADASGCAVVLSREPEAVLLGSAILGAVAAKLFPSIPMAMAAMSHRGRVTAPARGQAARYHAAKYRVFQRLYEDQIAYRAMMAEANDPPTVEPRG